MRRRALPVLILPLLAALSACDEVRRPPGQAIPPGLGTGAPDAVPALAREVAAAFADGGRSLAGNPTAMARAAGQMEWLPLALDAEPRWQALPLQVRSELRTARVELRAALGTRAGAPPEAVARALGQAHLALRAGDTRAAAQLLDPALFEPGGAVTLARLAAPGPLLQQRLASGLAREEIERAARLGLSGPAAALDPGMLQVQPGLRTGIR